MSGGERRALLPALVAPAATLDAPEWDRYSRQILLPGYADESQRRLKNARVLVIGAGGLGSPALFYLAAAGVGTIGIVDDDQVETSNLQRQIVHTTHDVDRRKVDSARDALYSLNPLVTVHTYAERLTAENAPTIFAGYDLVIDGSDNFDTRYVVSDAAERADIPCVWGAVLQFEAQITVFSARHGHTYRGLFPDSPPAGSAPSCGEAGVLGVLCGVAGTTMAGEAIKLLTGIGQPLLGRLLVIDMLTTAWRELEIEPDFGASAARSEWSSQSTGTSGAVASADSVSPLACADAGQPPRFPQSAFAPGASSNSVASSGPVETITAIDLARALAGVDDGEGFVVVDVREVAEFASGTVPTAVSVPLSTLKRSAEIPGVPRDMRVVLCCQVGVRAQHAGALLTDAGYRRLHVLDGGLNQWNSLAPALRDVGR